MYVPYVSMVITGCQEISTVVMDVTMANNVTVTVTIIILVGNTVNLLNIQNFFSQTFRSLALKHSKNSNSLRNLKFGKAL